MPCDSVREIGVDLRAADPEILLRALERAGFSGARVTEEAIYASTAIGQRITITDGQVQMRGAYIERAEVERVAATVTRAYAEEAVVTACKRYGYSWAKAADGRLNLSRRGF